jgi:hypothetical protein
LHFFEELEKFGTNKVPGAIGTIKLPQRQINASSDTNTEIQPSIAE